VARRLAGGPGATIVAPLPGGAEAAPVVDDPALVLSLGEALGLSAGLAAALPPAWLVEDAADAARLARRHPGVAFVSRDGIWAAGGALHVAAGEAAPGALERERELAALDEELARLAAGLEANQGLLADLVARRSAAARDANHLQGEVARLRQEGAVADARLEDAGARHRRSTVARETLATESAEVERELGRRAGAHDELAAALAEAERRHRSLEEEADAARQALEADQGRREALREASAGRRGRLELLRERFAAHEREMARLEREAAEGERQVGEWQAEGERLKGRAEELEREIATAAPRPPTPWWWRRSAWTSSAVACGPSRGASTRPARAVTRPAARSRSCGCARRAWSTTPSTPPPASATRSGGPAPCRWRPARRGTTAPPTATRPAPAGQLRPSGRPPSPSPRSCPRRPRSRRPTSPS
jgi:predicted  nucleic acid-binding Zn-ribbon protein